MLNLGFTIVLGQSGFTIIHHVSQFLYTWTIHLSSTMMPAI